MLRAFLIHSNSEVCFSLLLCDAEHPWLVKGWLLKLIASSSQEVNNRVQSLLLNYHFALLRSGDFTLVYYQMEELEYIRITELLL